MINLCEDIKLAETVDCGNDLANKPIDQLLKRQIELYLQFNPDYEFDRVEFEWKDGIWTATPMYRHKRVQNVEDLKEKLDEFRANNII